MAFHRFFLIFLLVILNGCTVHYRNTFYLDEKECLSCGWQVRLTSTSGKDCTEPDKRSREKLKIMMGDKYPKSCQQKDLKDEKRT